MKVDHNELRFIFFEMCKLATILHSHFLYPKLLQRSLKLEFYKTVHTMKAHHEKGVNIKINKESYIFNQKYLTIKS